MFLPSHTCSVLINKKAYYCLINFTSLFEISAGFHLALSKVDYFYYWSVLCHERIQFFFIEGGGGILPRGRGAPGPINAIFGNFTMWIQFLRWNLPGGWSDPPDPPDSPPLLDPRTIALKKWLTTLYFLLMLWSRRDQTCQCRLWRGTIQTVQTEAGHYWRGAVGRVGKQGTTRRQKRTPTLTMATPKGPVSITFCLILRYL